MTRDEFAKEFKGLHARFPGFIMPDPKTVLATYFQDLQFYPLVVFKKGMQEALAKNPTYFPTAAELKAGCETVKAVQQAKGSIPRKRYDEGEHANCLVHGKPQVVSGPRRQLCELSSYEGGHVLCPGVIRPVCPECGQYQEPWHNPLILMFIEKFPTETAGWSAWHKGNLLCERCAPGLDGPHWVEALHQRRTAEVRR
jgi:hypothetical protein